MSDSHTHNICIDKALELAEQICAQSGARFTDQRRRVFEIIWQSPIALTAAEIMEKMDNKQPPITYRALEFLKTQKLVHHITSLNAYVGCSHSEAEDHLAQMLVCTECKKVTEVPASKAMKALHEEAQKQNFRTEQTHIETLGICDEC